MSASQTNSQQFWWAFLWFSVAHGDSGHLLASGWVQAGEGFTLLGEDTQHKDDTWS